MTENIHSNLMTVLPFLQGFALMLTRDRARAEDLTQDTVVRVLGKSALFTPGTNFKAWVFTIMRNLYRDSLRQNRREAISDIGMDMLENLHSTGAHQEDRLVLRDLMNAVSGLNPHQREVLWLVAVNGLSYEQAAKVCDCAVGTVRSRLARARQTLQRVLLDNEPGQSHEHVVPQLIN